jgi:hypothetical protein
MIVSSTMPIYRRRVGLGAAVAQVIDGVPAPAPLKRAMRRCGGCKRRAAKLDAMMPNVNPFAPKPEPVMQPPETPPAP